MLFLSFLRLSDRRFAQSGEAARFVLGSFGLKCAVEMLPAKLHRFLQSEPSLRWRISSRQRWVHAKPNRFSDLVIAKFAVDGSLRALQPMLEERQVDQGIVDSVANDIVRAYNRSRHDDDLQRARRLWEEWNNQVSHHNPWPAGAHEKAVRYARRILGSAWLSMEKTTDRWIAPDFFHRKAGGMGALNLIARPQPSGQTDLWMQAHPAAMNPQTVQEGLNRLTTEWGRDPIHPEPGCATAPRTAGRAAGQIIQRSHEFLDFRPLLALQKSLEVRLDTAITGRLQLAALLVWCLARQTEFEQAAFSVTCDECRQAVVIRPSDYFHGINGPRLSAYVREFNRLLGLAREGRSAPPDPSDLIAVTLINNAEVFLVGMSDRKSNLGCMGLGNLGEAASISFVGPAGRIEGYPVALRRTIADCAKLV